MSGQYKFDARNELIDEIKLVSETEQTFDDTYGDNHSLGLPAKTNGYATSSKPSAIQIFIVVLLVIILVFLVILLGVTAFGVVQDQLPITAPTTTPTASSTCAPQTGTLTGDGKDDDGTGYNSTIQNEISQQLRTILASQQDGMNFIKNSTLILAQLIQALNQQQMASAQNRTAAITKQLQSIYQKQAMYNQSNVNMLQLILQSSDSALQKLTNIVNTLSNIKDTGVSSAAIIDDILLVVEELLQLQNASALFNSITPVSCQDIRNVLPNGPSGYYHVNSRNVYCNMGELCGVDGGWTRVAYLDMSDAAQNCPSGFKPYSSGSTRACGRYSSGCSVSVKFPSDGISYSEICGRVYGYQYGSPDGTTSFQSSLDQGYIDGVSITQGYPRKHIWSFIAGLRDSYYHVVNCICNNPPGGAQKMDSFIEGNYFCESGNPTSYWQLKLYTGDPLWDGQGCGSQEANCCAASGLPWFYRNFGAGNETTDYLELRVCSDQHTGDEDVPVGLYEIYIR